MKDVEEVWNIIEKYKNDNAKDNQISNDTNGKIKDESQNGNNNFSEEKNSKNKENESNKRKNSEETEESPKKKKHKKNRQSEDAVTEGENVQNIENDEKKKKKHKNNKEGALDSQTEEVVEETIQFNFQEKILEIVTAKRSISLKKLQKKVLNAYVKETDQTEITPKAIKKFNKKLKKIPNLEITEDQVTISETNN